MQVVAGPRQVGKSTLVDQVLQDMTIPHSVVVADAVDPNDSDWIHRVWEAARTTMRLRGEEQHLSLIHISEPTRRRGSSYAVFCLKKKKDDRHQNDERYLSAG